MYWAHSGPVPGMNFPAGWRTDVDVLWQPEWTATNQTLLPLSLLPYAVTPYRPSSIGQQLEPLHRTVQVFFLGLLNFWRIKSWSVSSRGMWSVLLQTRDHRALTEHCTLPLQGLCALDFKQIKARLEVEGSCLTDPQVWSCALWARNISQWEGWCRCEAVLVSTGLVPLSSFGGRSFEVTYSSWLRLDSALFYSRYAEAILIKFCNN